MDTSEDVTPAKRVYGLLSRKKTISSWWPGEDPFEIAVGAILTQSTSWRNVEKAIHNLKQDGLMSPAGIRNAKLKNLAALVRPSLYFNQKARKLKVFTDFLYTDYGGSMKRMRREDAAILREKLLSLWGVGRETADSILCYALNKPVFVVDAYTRRLFSRLGHVDEKVEYEKLQDFFHSQLDEDTLFFKHYHGLIVEHCKYVCKKNNPGCSGCVLSDACRFP